MKRHILIRPLAVGTIVLSLCLLLAALVTATRSQAAPSTRRPRAISAPTDALVPESTAAYNGVITPATTVYAPWLLGGTSSLRVYNAGGDAATVEVAFLHAGGPTVVEKTLPAGAVGDIRPGATLSDTQLSAILTGTRPLVAVVNDFGPENKQAASYAAMPAGLGQTYLMLPDVIFESGRGDSQIAVQNVGASSTGVTVIYTQTVGVPAPTSWTDDSVQDLAPGAVHVFDPGQAGLPNDFEGVATVKTTQPVVAIVRNARTEIGALYPEHVYIYRVPLPAARGSGNRPLYFPLLFSAYENWDTGLIQLLNPTSSAVGFGLVISDVASSESLSGWATDFYEPGRSDHGENWVGAGRVPDAQNLQGLVWLRGDFTQNDFLAAYTAPSVGARTWYLPYADQVDTLLTYVAVQNLSADSTTEITLTYHNVSGTLAPVPGGSIAPYGMKLIAAGAGLGRGVVVDADQPVAAVAVLAGQLVLDQTTYLPLVRK